MLLFAISATEGGEKNRFVEFLTSEIEFGTAVTLKYWHLLLAILVLAVIAVILIIVSVKSSKKAKRVLAESETVIDVSSDNEDEKNKEIIANNDDCHPVEFLKEIRLKKDSKTVEEAKSEPSEEEIREEINIPVVEPAVEEKAEEPAIELPVEEKAEEPVVESALEEPANQSAIEVSVEENKAEPVVETGIEEKAEELVIEEQLPEQKEEIKKEVETEEKVEESVAKEEENDKDEKAVANEIVVKPTTKSTTKKKAEKSISTKTIIEESTVVEEKEEKAEQQIEKTDEAVAESKVTGKIEICNSDIGGYNYLLLANNGQLLYESRSYKSIDSCREAITNFVEAVAVGMFTIRADKFKNYKFILKSPTSNTLLYIGESFSTEISCRNNIESVKRFAPISSIIDITEKDFNAKFVRYEIPEGIVKAVEEGTGAVGKWEIARVEDGVKNSPFVYLLYANNGQLLYESRDYKTAVSCLNGLKTFVNTVRNGYFIIDPDKSGRYKFVLRSKSVNSPMEYYGQNYDTQKACSSSIESVYRFALLSPVPEKA